MEIWKDIKGFEGEYQISSLGNVKSLERTIIYIQKNQYGEKETTKKVKECLLNPRYTKNSYARVQLNNKDFYIHRLVAANFIRPLKPKEEIDHINGHKKDNRLCNLEIVDRQTNQQRAYNNHLSKISGGIIITINGVEYKSLGLAAGAVNVSKTRLSKIINTEKLPYFIKSKNILIEKVQRLS